MYKKFKTLLGKYSKGIATPTEQAVVNQFFDKMQVGGVTAKEVERNTKLHHRLHHRVTSKTRPTFFNSSFVRIGIPAACSLCFFLLYFFVSTKVEVQQLVQQAKKGEQLIFYLSDSTRVYLNSNSTLRYPNQFLEDTRTVTLEGEAYFEVKRDESKPFIVESPHLSTMVLGTKFHINDFLLETTSVSVHEGKVKVTSNTSKEEVILVQNEQALFDKKMDSFNKGSINLQTLNQWIIGRVQFNQTPIMEVIQVLNRRFDVNIELVSKKKDLATYPISGDFNGTNIEEILQGLHFIYDIKYTKQTDKNYVLYIN